MIPQRIPTKRAPVNRAVNAGLQEQISLRRISAGSAAGGGRSCRGLTWWGCRWARRRAPPLSPTPWWGNDPTPRAPGDGRRRSSVDKEHARGSPETLALLFNLLFYPFYLASGCLPSDWRPGLWRQLTSQGSTHSLRKEKQKADYSNVWLTWQAYGLHLVLQNWTAQVMKRKNKNGI
jgi:hypothetical protein